MKTYQIQFKIRYINKKNADLIIELVDIENDSTIESEKEQIQYYYSKYVVRVNSNVAEVYPNDYIIVNKNFKVCQKLSQ